MCWESNNIPEVKVAEKNIKTFKVMYRDLKYEELFSYFFYKLYSIGKITSKIILSYEKFDSSCYIHAGYHSYDINIKQKHYYDYKRGVYIVKIGNVEEYYIEPFSNIFQTLCVVECTIPKGVEYYVNEYGEYVSEQIIVDKILAEY